VAVAGIKQVVATAVLVVAVLLRPLLMEQRELATHRL
jgi:hypothetical protein